MESISDKKNATLGVAFKKTMYAVSYLLSSCCLQANSTLLNNYLSSFSIQERTPEAVTVLVVVQKLMSLDCRELSFANESKILLVEKPSKVRNSPLRLFTVAQLPVNSALLDADF